MPQRAVLFLLCASLFAGTALAAPSAADRARANALMDQADELAQKDRHEEALARYREAHAIMGVPSTGIEVARTLEKLGRLAEAWQMAREVAAIPAAKSEPKPFAEARAEAGALERTLEARLPRLVIAIRGVPEGSEASVRLDGKPLTASALAAPLRLDPGRHEIVAAFGEGVRTERLELAEGERRTVTLSFARPRSGRTDPPPERARETSPTLGWIIGGIGVAGLATAGVTGAMIISRDGQIEDNCPDKRCNSEGDELVRGSRTLLTINAVAFGVGVIATGVGAYLVLSHDRDGETAIAPRAGSNAASVTLLRRF